MPRKEPDERAPPAKRAEKAIPRGPELDAEMERRAAEGMPGPSDVDVDYEKPPGPPKRVP